MFRRVLFRSKMGLAVVGGKVGLGGQWGSMAEVTLCPEGKGRG